MFYKPSKQSPFNSKWEAEKKWGWLTVREQTTLWNLNFFPEFLSFVAKLCQKIHFFLCLASASFSMFQHPKKCENSDRSRWVFRLDKPLLPVYFEKKINNEFPRAWHPSLHFTPQKKIRNLHTFPVPHPVDFKCTKLWKCPLERADSYLVIHFSLILSLN